MRLEKEQTTGPAIGGLPKDGALATLTRHELLVESVPPLRIALACERWEVDVSVASPPERIAYRCTRTEPWNVVYVAPPPPGYVEWHRAFGMGAPETSADGFPAWERVPSIAEAAPKMVLTNGAPPHTVLAAVRARGGTAAIAALLPQIVTMQLRYEPEGQTDVWVEALRTLSEAEGMAARQALRKALGTPNTGEGPVRRALLVYDAKDESIVDDLAKRLLEVDEAQRSAKPTGDVMTTVWQREALERLLATRPRDAATIGCARLVRNRFDEGARRAAALGSCPAEKGAK